MNPINPIILITVDVEDWFHVENFKQYIPFSSWSTCELRVEKNTHRLLDLFDICSTTHNSIKTTFFILGWVAERLPHLVSEIFKRGHEIASHGYSHGLCFNCSASHLKKDLYDSKKLLEDITGASVFGYRAPSFSINNDILKIIEDCDYLYDSSYNSFDRHGRYGHVVLNGNKRNGISVEILNDFYEIPISNITVGNLVLPWGGGGYFRLIPFPLFLLGVQSILKRENAYLFYIHPWEVDPDQPKVSAVSTSYRIRHYVNLKKTYSRLAKLLKSFNKHCFVTCRQYLELNMRGGGTLGGKDDVFINRGS